MEWELQHEESMYKYYKVMISLTPDVRNTEPILWTFATRHL
jgi:hypothetical protein